MEETWRWFGPKDAVTLRHIRQTGARGIVTSLHEIPYGEVWSVAAIEERKALIAADPTLGLRWSVVESLPIHEAIKLDAGDQTRIIDNYRASMRNLAACGVTTICYNFMPVIDWTRTELAWPTPGGGRALRFGLVEFAAFDCYMLNRPRAEDEFAPETLDAARRWVAAASEADKDRLLAAIMAGLPGAYDRYDIPGLRTMLARYDGVTGAVLRERLVRFLQAIIPLAEELGLVFAIHPDDPPRSLMGLPRIVSTEADIGALLGAVDSPANGLTLCSGSLGAGPANDVPGIAARFARRVHFAHLRNVAKEADGSFTEADHLDGDTDMVALVTVLLAEQERRRLAGDGAGAGWRIPMRPDHGHELIDDIGRGTHPGYPIIGRLKGLAELRGVMRAVSAAQGWPLA